MFTMTIATISGLEIARLPGNPMCAGRVGDNRFIMARATRDGFGDEFVRVRHLGNVSMAAGAGITGMARSGVLRSIHKKIYGFPGGIFFSEGFILMAPKAVGIVDGKSLLQHHRDKPASQDHILSITHILFPDSGF